MENKGGAVLFARKILQSEIFVLKPASWFKIWFYIVSMANHEDRGVFKRGELFTSYSRIIAETKERRNTVDHFIRWAKSSDMIATRKATRGMFIKVLKYEEYQTLNNYQKRNKSDGVGEIKAKQKRYRGDTIHKNEKNEKNVSVCVLRENAQTHGTHTQKFSSVRERQQAFIEEVKEAARLLGTNDGEEVRSFIEWWGEPADKGIKIKRDFEKTWNTKIKLKGWLKLKNKRYGKNY